MHPLYIEIMENLSHAPDTVEYLTKRSKLTKYEGRIGMACREMERQGYLKAVEIRRGEAYQLTEVAHEYLYRQRPNRPKEWGTHDPRRNSRISEFTRTNH